MFIGEIMNLAYAYYSRRTLWMRARMRTRAEDESENENESEDKKKRAPNAAFAIILALFPCPRSRAPSSHATGLTL